MERMSGRERARPPWRRGMFFSLDAVLATSILIIGLVLVSSFFIGERRYSPLTHIAEDLTDALSTITIMEVQDDPYIGELIADGNITELNNSILEQIGHFWALNRTALAQNIARNMTERLIPPGYGYGIYVGGDPVYVKNATLSGILLISRKMVSGIEKGQPILGATSQAFLKGIRRKESSSYAYFGGFVGQGNLTRYIDGIPADANITRMGLELDTGGDFVLLINGVPCDDPRDGGAFEPPAGNMTANYWDISACNSSVVPGARNRIRLIFSGGLNESYVGGGLLRVSYLTTQMVTSNVSNRTRYYFPGIDGVINLYSGFSVPGVLNAWTINISYFSNYTTYLTIGNETVFYRPGDDVTQNVTYSRTGLNMTPGTIPLRLGITNISNITQILAGKPADTILVTDVSGSMDDCGEWYTGLLCQYRCGFIFSWWMRCPFPGSCVNEECGTCWNDRDYSTPTGTVCSRSKLEVAKEADGIAVDIILNTTGNEVGLVSYEADVDRVYGLSSDRTGLRSEVDSYTAGGGTCICCGINRAKDMIASSADKRFMIVLSDGDANYRCDGFSDYTGTSDPTNAPQSAIDAGENACDNHNITVFAIGFGDAMTAAGHATMAAIACNSSLYYNATNVSELADIYRNISNMIVQSANFTSQVITLIGNVTLTNLSPESYIDLAYTPIADPIEFGEITLDLETPQFPNCTPQVYIHDDYRIIGARVTSYSSEKWTSLVTLNDYTVFNLSSYGLGFVSLGDPFTVEIPSVYFRQGTLNNLTVLVGEGPTNVSGCSANDTLIYTVALDASVSYPSVLPLAAGCSWTIELQNTSTTLVLVPETYGGAKSCLFTNASVSFDGNDSIDDSVFRLLSILDFDDDGRINVDIVGADLTISAIWVPRVPYMWGPSVVEVRVWQ
ncbi:VWA domain-containing protein [Candidatus Woesearchaeota archaeon]|nr:VWA domain-containing protein [Candidatus Woesearchaeota archaeon]